MTVELLRRLLDSGAPLSPIEVALACEVEQGVPFVRALLDRSPELAALLERELERADAAEIHVVRASTELSRLLPKGMCERLMAVPVFRDPQGGRVDVAAVDVFDPHLAQEFGFQLQAKVRMLRARPAQIRAALEALAGTSSPVSSRGRRASPLPHPAEDPPEVVHLPSDAPIPLVRRPSAASDEPVLNLTRSKAPPRAPFAFTTELEPALESLARADTAEAVARALCGGLEPAAALVSAVRPNGFEARAASTAVAPDAQSFSVALGKNSVFDIAVRNGFFLGPLPATLVHAELRALLPSTALEEVYAAPVLVAQKPALVLVMACFGPTLLATRRADRLIQATAEAIERIVRSRKVR